MILLLAILSTKNRKSTAMTSKITYPLTVALDLSPVGGALYESGEGQVHVHTLEGWLVTGELDQQTMCEECEDYEWCSWYLSSRSIPEDRGWLPEPLAFLPDDGWM